MSVNRIIILLILAFAGSGIIIGQTIEYAYDNNGNRVGRSIVIEELKSQSFSFPVENIMNLQTAEKAMQAALEENNSEEKGEPDVIIYPNPSRGLLNIEIVNLSQGSQNEMRLYDLSGTELIIKKDFGSTSDLNINMFKAGIYILRIKIDEKLFDFKVIKH
ncbi:MAG: T9SS type A sorting domain-containing protein [Bacteroidota bacterium]